MREVILSILFTFVFAVTFSVIGTVFNPLVGLLVAVYVIATLMLWAAEWFEDTRTEYNFNSILDNV